MPDYVITTPSVDVESIFYAFYRILLKMGSVFDSSADATTPDISSAGFQNFYFYTEVFLFFVGVAALVLLIHYYLAKQELLRAQETVYQEGYASKKLAPERNVLWDSIREHLATESPTGWKLAVIEADKLLDDLTVKQGFFGGTLGERLKNADESLFRTLQDAWEAHKIRNRIAHETGYYLSRREAQRAIGMYENVFREFKVI